MVASIRSGGSPAKRLIRAYMRRLPDGVLVRLPRARSACSLDARPARGRARRGGLVGCPVLPAAPDDLLEAPDLEDEHEGREADREAERSDRDLLADRVGRDHVR